MRHNGNPAENAVAAVLRELGYLVASRRHEPGPGDHLATPTNGAIAGLPLLVETKGGRDPWENFRRADREAMISAAIRWHVTPLLAFVLDAKRREVMWLPVEDWPA